MASRIESDGCKCCSRTANAAGSIKSSMAEQVARFVTDPRTAVTLRPNSGTFSALRFPIGMRLPIDPICSRWKSLGLCLLLAVAPSATVFAAGEPADADALRQQAVAQYVDGATKELEAYGQQIDAAARPDNQKMLREAKAKLDECSRMVTDLKSADQAHFDIIKGNYERTRGELAKAVQAAQKTQ
jgi:hypothetical protein